MKLCKDCFHFQKQDGVPHCIAPGTTQDLVTGEDRLFKETCTLLRTNSSMPCGPEGKLWLDKDKVQEDPIIREKVKYSKHDRRKRASGEFKKNKCITTWVTQETHTLLHNLASESQQSLGDYLRTQYFRIITTERKQSWSGE